MLIVTRDLWILSLELIALTNCPCSMKRITAFATCTDYAAYVPCMYKGLGLAL